MDSADIIEKRLKPCHLQEVRHPILSDSFYPDTFRSDSILSDTYVSKTPLLSGSPHSGRTDSVRRFSAVL